MGADGRPLCCLHNLRKYEDFLLEVIKRMFRPGYKFEAMF